MAPAAAAGPERVDLASRFTVGSHFVYAVASTMTQSAQVSGAGQNIKSTEVTTGVGRVSFTITSRNRDGVATADMHMNIIVRDTYNGKTTTLRLTSPHVVRLWPDGHATEKGTVPYFLAAADTYGASFPGIPQHPVRVGSTWIERMPGYEYVPGLPFDHPVPLGPLTERTTVLRLRHDGPLTVADLDSRHNGNYRVRARYKGSPVQVHDVEALDSVSAFDLRHHRLRSGRESYTDRIYARITVAGARVITYRYQTAFRLTISPADVSQ